MHQKERRRQDILDEIEDWGEQEFSYMEDFDEDEFEQETILAARQLNRYAERYSRLQAQFLDESRDHYLDDPMLSHALKAKGDTLAGYLMGLRAAARYLSGEGIEALRYEGDLIATQNIVATMDKRAKLEDAN
jgi:hypothetical protein